MSTEGEKLYEHDDDADVRSELLDAKAALGRIRHALGLDKTIPMTAFGYLEIATATIRALEERQQVKLFATHRQTTAIPYIHHAYVYEGNKVIMACTHRHGERAPHHGGETAQACAERMLRKVLRRRKTSCSPTRKDEER